MSLRKRNITKKSRTVSKKVRRRRSVREKLMVIYYSERTQNNRATAKRFDIEPKQVRDWQSKKQELLNSAPYLLTLNRGRPAQYPLLEERLVEWIETLRNKQMAVTQKIVVTKAKQLVRINEIKEAYPNIGDFRFSNSWLNGFLYRNELSNRRRTTVSQHLPKDLIDLQNEFLSLVLFKHRQYNYDIHHIGNINETPLSFDLPYPVTFDKHRVKTIGI